MTTNIERAIEEIRALGRVSQAQSESIAQALADAGLLMPKLPEPSEELIWYEASGDLKNPFEVWASDHHGTVEIVGMGQPQIHIPIERARHLALCIIAAAKLAEEKK